jgi:hypothetical protein
MASRSLMVTNSLGINTEQLVILLDLLPSVFREALGLPSEYQPLVLLHNVSIHNTVSLFSRL